MTTPFEILMICIAVSGTWILVLFADYFFSNPVPLLNNLFDHRVIINCERQPYLLRWYVLRTKRVSLFLHKFVRSDEDRALHDHPWAFLVIPIWRGYVEHTPNPNFEELTPKAKPLAAGYGMATSRRRRVWPFISARYRPALFRHRVELLSKFTQNPQPGVESYDFEVIRETLPAWSLFFHFTKEREWGFHPAQGFVNWKDWWSSHKCGDEQE